MTTTYHRAAKVGRTYTTPNTLEVIACANCGLLFGVPESYLNRRREDGRGFHCPNGHSLSYHETETDRQRERAEREERYRRAAEDTAARWKRNAEAERRTAAAYKGHLTRAKNRIANGVCPVPGCKRSGFDQVMDHIAAVHPDWLHTHPEVQP